MDEKGPLIVALDFDSSSQALALARLLDPQKCRVKVGKQLFTHEGPAILHALNDLGFEIFLDLKFHDIPNTVAKACRAAAEHGVWMVNVHAAGGSRMMKEAKASLSDLGCPPKLIAVTVLTSMAPEDLVETGAMGTPLERAVTLAELTRASGLDGVVCSAREAPAIREHLGDDFLLITPGIRLHDDALGDQRRVLTPSEAIAAGANYLVVGRPITAAEDPAQALARVLASISGN